MTETASYADTLQAQTLLEMVGGGETLAAACAATGAAVSTIYYRIDRDEKFREAMERARKAGAQALASSTLRVAKGEAGFSSGDVKRDTLICKQINHLLSKWHPNEYGEKLQVEQKTATVAIPVSDDPIAAQREYEKLMKFSG